MLTILKIGHPLLRKRAAPISAKKITRTTRDLAKAMVKEMRRVHGVGLAANQIGKGIQLIVLECQTNRRYPKAPRIPLKIYVNPKILNYSESVTRDWEGCLSIPNYRGKVPRSREILLDALTLDGKNVREIVTGFEARILQHEVDHLNGKFYVDRLKDMRDWFHVDEGRLKVRKRRRSS